jgi:hypothetical protein
MLHDADFSDLSVCSFWLPPGAQPGPHTMTIYASKPWANATVSIYPATAGTTPSHQWVQLDDLVLQTTSDLTIGTECIPPASTPNLVAATSGAARSQRASASSPAPVATPQRPPAASIRTPMPETRTSRLRPEAIDFVADYAMQHVVAGYTLAWDDADLLSIVFGIRLADGIAEVWEHGVVRHRIRFQPGDRFRIEIADGVVMYSSNGSPFHASASPYSEPLAFVVVPFDFDPGVRGH